MFELLKRHRAWLFPTVLILFVLEMITLPIFINVTYASRSESPSHVLTYTPNRLIWDDKTDILPDGSVKLNLFSSESSSYSSADGADIVAPGASGKHTVRLKSNVIGTVDYSAVLYRLRDDETIHLEASFAGVPLTENARQITLPEHITQDDVLQTVSGSLEGGRIRDFDIDWNWAYTLDDLRDETDTALGDNQEKSVTLGIYIFVEDGNNYVTPSAPLTSDDARMILYCLLIGVSLTLLILMLIGKRREQNGKSQENA